MQTIDLFDEVLPAARAKDPVTSKVAALAAVELAVKHREIVLGALSKWGPMSKDQIAAKTRIDGVSVCRRLPELQRQGLVEPTGETRPSTSGRPERVWRVRSGA